MQSNKKISSMIVRKIVFIIIVLISLLTVGVIATKKNINYVTIIFDDSRITVMTSKTKISEILEENKIVILENEFVYPAKDSEIGASKTITISKEEKQKTIISEEVKNISTEEILGNYKTIVEKIVIEQEEIPFETITKDISTSNSDTSNKVIQEGKNGIKNVKYKIKYQNDIAIEKMFISEEIVKEPVDKIIQIYTKVSNRSTGRDTQIAATSAAVANSVAGKEPKIMIMNVSAYTASTCDKSPSDPGYGITSSGAAATAWRTIAAGKGYPIGTVIYIPYFASQPNGGWFVVQDRGGAISNTRLDVYMDTYQECIQFGRRNLECYVYN